MLLRLADPDERFVAVRLASDLPPHEFARTNGEWRLELDEPVERLEYQLEVQGEDGETEYILDPDNPLTAPGAFGDKSVALLPSYTPPAWLDAPTVEGQLISVTSPGRGLQVDIDLWSPADAHPQEPLPLLVAHDGPEYDRLSELTRFAAAQIAAGELPRHRIALLAPRERNEWYSASPRYTRALIGQVLPSLPPQPRPPGGDGRQPRRAGAAARRGAAPAQLPRALPAVGQLLHAALRRARVELPLLPPDRRFRERDPAHGVPDPRAHHAHLRRGGGEHRQQSRHGGDAHAPLHEVLDTHNYTAWRDALHPHLTRQLQAAW